MHTGALPAVTGQDKRLDARRSLDRVVRHLITQSAKFAHENAYAEITIRWKAGQIDSVTEQRLIKPWELPGGDK